MKQKILIIKLGYSETLDSEISLTTSLGDVLRTTVVLHLFKNDNVSWLVDEKAYRLLEGNPYINRILLFNLPTVIQLQNEKFDTVINFEKVPGICALADSINAWRRFGFRFDADKGAAQAYDYAEEVYKISHDPKYKKKHKKYWQEALFEMLGFKWQNENYILGYKPKSKIKFDIGFNWLVGSKWTNNKAWSKENWIELEKLIEKKYSIDWQRGVDNIYDYIEWINSCRLLITNDSLGLHIALALNRKIIVLLGPTHSGEVFFYNLGIGIFPEVKRNCIPCHQPICKYKKKCIDYISPECVYSMIKKIL